VRETEGGGERTNVQRPGKQGEKKPRKTIEFTGSWGWKGTRRESPSNLNVPPLKIEAKDSRGKSFPRGEEGG